MTASADLKKLNELGAYTVAGSTYVDQTLVGYYDQDGEFVTTDEGHRALKSKKGTPKEVSVEVLEQRDIANEKDAERINQAQIDRQRETAKQAVDAALQSRVAAERNGPANPLDDLFDADGKDAGKGADKSTVADSRADVRTDAHSTAKTDPKTDAKAHAKVPGTK